MVERQPGRASEAGFLGAAVRYAANMYDIEERIVFTGFFRHYIDYVEVGKQFDEDTVIAERIWEESVVVESLREYAARRAREIESSDKS